MSIKIPCIYDDRDKGYGIKISNYCPTQRAERYGIKVLIKDNSDVGFKIRRLTPKECWRLMDFSDKDFDSAKNAGVSNSQLYKQAGNSICVGVLYHLYKSLYNVMPYLFDDLKVSSFFSGIGAFEKGLDRLYSDINGKKTIK